MNGDGRKTKLSELCIPLDQPFFNCNVNYFLFRRFWQPTCVWRFMQFSLTSVKIEVLNTSWIGCVIALFYEPLKIPLKSHWSDLRQDCSFYTGANHSLNLRGNWIVQFLFREWTLNSLGMRLMLTGKWPCNQRSEKPMFIFAKKSCFGLP